MIRPPSCFVPFNSATDGEVKLTTSWNTIQGPNDIIESIQYFSSLSLGFLDPESFLRLTENDSPLAFKNTCPDCYLLSIQRLWKENFLSGPGSHFALDVAKKLSIRARGRT